MNTFSRHRVRPAATSISVWTLAVLVSCLALHQLWAYLDVRAPHVADALLGGLVAAAATALGTVPILFARSIPQKLQDSMFGFGAGVMLAASAFSLVAPGIAAARGLGYGPWGAGLTVAGAVLLGAAVLLLMDRTLPHEHFIKGREGIEAHRLRRTWLFVFAITLHNLPEGLAIGVGYAGNDPLRGTALATGIAIQDIPEGLVVAVALLAAGYPRAFAAALGMLSGMVEPLGAVLGAAVVGWSAPMLPWAWASPPAPCCSSSATRSSPSRTARGTRSTPPAG